MSRLALSLNAFIPPIFFLVPGCHVMPQIGLRYPAQSVVKSKEKFFPEETISE